jgi:hypothetical protein
LKATDGNRKGSEAGIRMANQKYMLIKHNAENNSAYLGREGGGGACIVRTKQCVIVGVWSKSAEKSNKELQTAGDCNELTERVARFLTESGY